jgi:hypothetical protein
MRVYLSGAVEYAPDHGRRWRADITPLLYSLGHEIYDPAQDEKKNLSDEEVASFRAYKESDLERFQQTVRKIIAYDLDIVERHTDYIICYWDEHATKGAGTHGEVTLAHRLGIPVYLVTGLPIAQVSGWILGCSTRVFTSFEALTDFLLQQHSQTAHIAQG